MARHILPGNTVAVPGPLRTVAVCGLSILLPLLIAWTVAQTGQALPVSSVFAICLCLALLGTLADGLVPGSLCLITSAFAFPWLAVAPTGGWASVLFAAAGIIGLFAGLCLRRLRPGHEAAAPLQQRELHFRQMADTIGEVFWLSTPDASVILYVSPAFESIWGHSCTELYANPTLWSDSIVVEDRARVQNALQALGRGMPYNIDFRILRPDGELRWINDRGYLRRDDHDVVLFTSGIATDITERRRVEDALRDSERRLAAVFESAMDGIISIDEAQRIILVNRAAESMFRRNAADMIGRPLEQFIPERFRDRHARDVDTFGRSGVTRRAMGRLGTVFGLRADGGEFPLEISISQIERDGARQYTAIFRDVSERADSERRIARLTRLYAVLSAINSIIVRVRDRQSLFADACRVLTETGGFTLAWIGLIERPDLRIRLLAGSGPDGDLEYIRDIGFSADANHPGGRTTAGHAARERRPVFSHELQYEGEIRERFDNLAARGYLTILSLPLLDGADCVGVLQLMSKETEAFDAEHMSLLNELAGDISFALQHLRNEERIEFLAYHDPLTGFANREKLRASLAQVLQQARPTQLPFALLLLNINSFRDINDTLGHANGDELLRAIAARLASTLQQNDIVANLGGDEFAILLPHLADKDHIGLVIRKISRSFRRPFNVQELPVNVEPRIGIALYPDHGGTADQLWQRADIALRTAKEQQRAHLIYAPEIDHFDPRRVALIGRLRQAMDGNELLLHYQPRVDLHGGGTIGVEALVRWQHPELGLLFPDRFIPFAERTSLIDPLTTWVLANALRQGHAWNQIGLALELSVNLSVRNLQDANLCQGVVDLARSSRFPLERLTLEVTESAIMTDHARAAAVLGELHAAGIRLSIDDFGIGHSSLAYIRDLPVSAMKIDKSFVMEFRRPGNAAIVRSTIELAHNLGLRVTAEGVEDRATCEALRALGCDHAQGYYFSKPQAVDRLTPWLRRSEWKCLPA